MISLGSGTYGSVSLHQMAVKSYRLVDELLNRDLLNEVSILKHLNHHQVKGVPIVYQVHSQLDPSSSISQSEVTLSLGGTSIGAMSASLSFNQTCNLVMSHLSGIMTIVNDIHRVGVVHNDLKFNNILIDGDQVMIVDFGISDFDGHNNPEAIYHQYYVPERITDRVARISNDIWTLGAFLSNLCIYKLGVNIIPTKKDQRQTIASMINPAIPSKYHTEIIEGRSKQEVYVQLPTEIPYNLRRILTKMLAFNPDDRGFYIDMIAYSDLPSVLYNPAYVMSYSPYLESYLDNVDRWRVIDGTRYITSSYVLIGIDIIRRCITLDWREYEVRVIGLAIYLLVVDYMEVQEVKDLIKNIELEGMSYSLVFQAQLKILTHLDWRILTRANSSLSSKPISMNKFSKIRDNYSTALNMNNEDLLELLM